MERKMMFQLEKATEYKYRVLRVSQSKFTDLQYLNKILKPHDFYSWKQLREDSERNFD
jgi:hypothetical protein